MQRYFFFVCVIMIAAWLFSVVCFNCVDDFSAFVFIRLCEPLQVELLLYWDVSPVSLSRSRRYCCSLSNTRCLWLYITEYYIFIQYSYSPKVGYASLHPFLLIKLFLKGDGGIQQFRVQTKDVGCQPRFLIINQHCHVCISDLNILTAAKIEMRGDLANSLILKKHDAVKFAVITISFLFFLQALT